jgi:hypothetical protein
MRTKLTALALCVTLLAAVSVAAQPTQSQQANRLGLLCETSAPLRVAGLPR